MRTGVLLMAHGTPTSLEEMPEYLTLVRGGRPPRTSVKYSGISSSEVGRSEEHTSELQSRSDLVCRLLLEKKNKRRAEVGELRRRASDCGGRPCTGSISAGTRNGWRGGAGDSGSAGLTAAGRQEHASGAQG